MSVARKMVRGMVALAIAAGVVAPASATTLVRSSLERLTKTNGAVVVGEVLDVHSYWNADRTFILTDVKLAVADVLKGNVDNQELTVTLMGGTVGDLTTLIVGGPELIPGNAYVVFLNQENLPGASDVTTVRDLSQGVFDLRMSTDGLKAVNQANGHPMVPDALGYIDAPGGVDGFHYKELVRTVRENAITIDIQEVK